MNVADHIGLRQGEEVAIVQQVLRCAPKALPSNIRLLLAIRADRRTHRSVDDGDTAFEDLLKRVLVGCGH